MPEIIKDFLDHVKVILIPPQPICWQTFVLASFLCWAMGYLAPPSWLQLFGALGWILLIVGLGWVTLAKGLIIGGISTGPWMVGVLVCLFWSSIETPATDLSIIITLWPVVSVIIAIGVELIQPNLNLELPSPAARQRLLIMLLINLLLSCWLHFHFLIQGWMQKYPTLMADDFRNSAFVVKWQTSAEAPRAAILLQLMERQLRERFQKEYTQRFPKPSTSPPPQVMPTPTLISRYRDVAKIGEQVLEQFIRLDRSLEQSLWKLDVKPITTGLIGQPERFQLSATWKGPTSNGQPHQLQTTCQIMPPPNPNSLDVGIRCDRPTHSFIP